MLTDNSIIPMNVELWMNNLKRRDGEFCNQHSRFLCMCGCGNLNNLHRLEICTKKVISGTSEAGSGFEMYNIESVFFFIFILALFRPVQNRSKVIESLQRSNSKR